MYIDERTYTDFFGTERKEKFYFNLTEAEVAELELTTDGGLQDRLQTIVDSKNQAEIVRQFKKIILLAYGEKSPDGRFFDKSDEISNRYSHTQAYSDLFMELSTNADKAAEFINKIMPESLRGAGEGKVAPMNPNA